MANEATQQSATPPVGGGTPPAPDEKPVFDDKQQEFVNTLIQKAMGKAGKEARDEAALLKTERDELKKQVDDLTKIKATTTSVEDKEKVLEEMRISNKQVQDQLQESKKALTSKDKEIENSKLETLNLRKQTAIHRAASRINFVNLDVVEKLTENQVKFDEPTGKFVVLGDNGVVKLNSVLDPMSLEEFYLKFATDNSYLVKGDLKSGIGSSESSKSGISGKVVEWKQVFGKGSSGKLANELIKTNPDLYHSLKEEWRKSGGNN
jgi:hypothetical protein